MGFFTDTSLCIGCKACEVACKEWNERARGPLGFTGSPTTTPALGADTWRHVAFVEQPARRSAGRGSSCRRCQALRWLMSSDVCKHCTHAACLEVCPTGALFRTEFGTVVVQQDVCNGCGYCVPACPFGVIDRREDDGRVWKCTLCYDRLKDGLEPACAKACPTDSIQFGAARRAARRAPARGSSSCTSAGVDEARLYGADPDDGVGGIGAFFLLLDEPEVYGLPPDPVDADPLLGDLGRGAARPPRSLRGVAGCSRREAALKARSAAAVLGGALRQRARGTPATGGPTMAVSEPVPRAPAATTRMWAGDRRRRDGALVPPAKPTSTTAGR